MGAGIPDTAKQTSGTAQAQRLAGAGAIRNGARGVRHQPDAQNHSAGDGKPARGNGKQRGQSFFGARHSDGGIRGVRSYLGNPGCGKTYRAIADISAAARCIFFDTAANIGAGELKNRLPRFAHSFGLHDLGMLLIEAKANLPQSRFRICYTPGLEKVDRRAEFEAVCELIKRTKNCVFVIDEVWKHCRAGWIPQPLEDLTFTGRHFGVTVLFTAQRPARVANDLLSICSAHHLFRMDAVDVATIRKYFSIPDDVVERLPSLPDRRYFYRDERLQWSLR
jgi:hypothetical protein